MNTRKHFNVFAGAFLILSAAAVFAVAQTAKTPNPRQEKLLNTLKVLMWQDASSNQVTVKLRVHGGAAFDTLGKEGTMALLADALFPNESVKEFFREDLGGSLTVENNYDYIQINATGNADQILTILETVANAVTKPTLDKETTAKVKAARLAKIQELEKNPAYVADLAVAKRLFGDYPYGRSAEGTSDSLAKIDFADLILAKQRFLTADNATIAVSGNIKYEYVFKAIRQLFGGWEKADKKVPATFAQPSAPDTTALILRLPDNLGDEARFAFRSTARSDKEFWGSTILAEILGKRFQKYRATARQNSNLLPGALNIKLSYIFLASATTRDIDEIIIKSFNPPVNQEELSAAKQTVLTELNKKSFDDYWLDVDTYKITSIKTDTQNAQNVALADVQAMAERIRKEPMATVLTISEKDASAPKN